MSCPPNSEGAGNAGRTMHPQPRVQMKKAHEHSHHGHTGLTRHSPRNGFTAYFALSPAIGLVCHRRLARLLADLTPASRRQNHTTSPSASAPFVKCAARVHRIPPRVRDDRERPSEGRDGNRYIADLGQARSGIFLQTGLDKGQSEDDLICPSGSCLARLRLSASKHQEFVAITKRHPGTNVRLTVKVITTARGSSSFRSRQAARPGMTSNSIRTGAPSRLTNSSLALFAKI
jgi:hypothetical protein